MTGPETFQGEAVYHAGMVGRFAKMAGLTRQGAIELVEEEFDQPELFESETSTNNGYDPRWVEAINVVLADRESSEVRIDDVSEWMFDQYIGRLVDEIERNGP